MKPLLFFFCFYFLCQICAAQTAGEQAFVATVKKVVSAFSRQDSLALMKFIDPKTGVYQLHRIGVMGTYNHFNTIGFSDATYPKVLFGYSKAVQLTVIKYAKLPTWSCVGESWSKTGLFVDTTKTDHLVSKICREWNKNASNTIPEKLFSISMILKAKAGE